MLRHPDFLYAFDVRGLYFHANLITEISTKVKWRFRNDQEIQG